MIKSPKRSSKLNIFSNLGFLPLLIYRKLIWISLQHGMLPREYGHKNHQPRTLR